MVNVYIKLQFKNGWESYISQLGGVDCLVAQNASSKKPCWGCFLLWNNPFGEQHPPCAMLWSPATVYHDGLSLCSIHFLKNRSPHHLCFWELRERQNVQEDNRPLFSYISNQDESTCKGRECSFHSNVPASFDTAIEFSVGGLEGRGASHVLASLCIDGATLDRTPEKAKTRISEECMGLDDIF